MHTLQQESIDPLTSLAGRSGAEIFTEILRAEGVEFIFGFPGAAVIPILDVLRDAPLRFVLTRHEQGAAHMADGYARSTGKVGVCLATSGPGATNLVTGLATAHRDSVPLVAVTGQVRSGLIGTNAFQEADVAGITRPVTKHNFLVTRVEEIGRVLRHAFHIARSGRPGPVLVDIAVDATTARTLSQPDFAIEPSGCRPRREENLQQIHAAAAAINAAERPVLLAGGGVIAAGAAGPLRSLAERGSIPVTTTLMGLGAFDETHPLALQMLGMHGAFAANHAVQEADCLIAVGARLDDRVTGKVEAFAPCARIVHVDIDPASIGKTVRAHLPVLGDAGDCCARLLEVLQPRDRTPWLERIAAWKGRHPFSYRREGRIKPQEVIETLGRMTGHDAIVATGVGQHQMWAAQFYGWRRPRQLVSSGGHGTMGFGCPAAIGAQFGNPGSLVIDIDGDGSFAMTMGELITAVQYRQPVKFVVLDNGYLGMVRQWQELFHGRRYMAVANACPEFATIAEAFGARGLRVRERGELGDAVAALLREEGPALLDVAVAPEENVYPMVPAGNALHEMELGTLAQEEGLS